MPTILAYTSPALGHVYPITALLQELQSRGHRIVVRTSAAAVRLSRAAGFEAAPIDPRIEHVALRDWTARTPLGALKLTMEVFGARGMLEVDDARRAIEEVEPDALIVDANCWGAAAVTDAASLPWAAFWPYPPFLRSRGVPPFGPGLPPWPGLAGRLRDGALRPFTKAAQMSSSPAHHCCSSPVPIRSSTPTQTGLRQFASSARVPTTPLRPAPRPDSPTSTNPSCWSPTPPNIKTIRPSP